MTGVEKRDSLVVLLLESGEIIHSLKLKMLLCSSEANGRAEPVPCKSEWVAQLKLCGSGLMI